MVNDTPVAILGRESPLVTSRTENARKGKASPCYKKPGSWGVDESVRRRSAVRCLSTTSVWRFVVDLLFEMVSWRARRTSQADIGSRGIWSE